MTDQPLLCEQTPCWRCERHSASLSCRYHLAGVEDVDDSGDRPVACNQRRLVVGCTSAMICGDVAGVAQDIMDINLHLNALEQGLGYFLLNAMAALLMIQSASSPSSSLPSSSASASASASASSGQSFGLHPGMSTPNTALSIFSSWSRLHPAARQTTRRLSEGQWAAAKQ